MSQPSPIERAFFREAEDGSSVFFPWGITYRGYRLADPVARKRASRSVSMLVSATTAIGAWAACLVQPLVERDATRTTEILEALAAPGAALLLVILFYWLWASRFVEGYAESDLKVSREERLRAAAAVASPRKVALIGVTLGSLSALLIYLKPHAWGLGWLGIALGIGTLLWSRALRDAAGGSSP